MDRLAFRHAIARHMGETLTPSLCAAIECEASMPSAKYIDLAQFTPAVAGAFTIQAERFADVLPELHPLHEAHWTETEKHRAGLTLKPDYDAMAADERGGRLLQFTVRTGGRLVGHVRLYVMPSRHSDNLLACEDTLYIAPDHRGGILGLRLLRYAEDCLRRIGVREIQADSKLLNRADSLMRRMGYAPVALQFHKLLEAPAGCTT